MSGKTAFGHLVAVVVAVCCCALSGCGNDVGDLDARDRALPLMRKAESCRAQGDVDGAVAFYRQALLKNPESARAHLDLALLMHDHKRDPIDAIYHYRRYLELRPETEKKRMIESRIRLATQSFISTASEDEREAIARAESLERENVALKTEIAALRKETAGLKEPAGGRGGATPAVPPGGRTYRVQRGDTLAGIAADIYGDASLWTRIYEANRDKIAEGNKLPVGAVLTIP